MILLQKNNAILGFHRIFFTSIQIQTPGINMQNGRQVKDVFKTCNTGLKIALRQVI